VKTYILLQNTHRYPLPPEFQDDDVRYSGTLVEHFVRAFTREGDVVFDPFAGYGTTLLVAEEMGRAAYGIEFDERRVRYVRSMLQHPDRLIHGDSRQLASYDLPAFDFSITSPPYMGRYDVENPFTAYSTEGTYSGYLEEIRSIYEQMGRLMRPGARVVIEVANLKLGDGVTTLAWDVAQAVSEVLHFEGEVVVGWDRYGYGYDHSYCLVYTQHGKRQAMDLCLAVAVSCTDESCRVQFLESQAAIDAPRSEPMVEHGITVRPGDLVAVDRGADPPQVVYRWPSIEAKRTEGGYALTKDGGPVDPDRLRAEGYPRIREMYGRMSVAAQVDPRQVVERGYDRIADQFLAMVEDEPPAHAQVRARYTSALFDQLPQGANVLELGCGPGVPTAQALARRFRVTGVDLSARQVALARRNVPEARFVQADMTQLEVPPASYDAVVAFWSLFHVPRQEQPQLLRDIAGWLRPGGLFVATLSAQPMVADVDELMGVDMYWSGFGSETNVRLIGEAGLEVVEAEEETLEEFGDTVTTLWVIARKPEMQVKH
jgi:SAM-dependent methyltransferase